MFLVTIMISDELLFSTSNGNELLFKNIFPNPGNVFAANTAITFYYNTIQEYVLLANASHHCNIHLFFP